MDGIHEKQETSIGFPSGRIAVDDAPSRHPSVLIDQLLQNQQEMTAVEQFSRDHQNGQPAQAKYYSSLLPASPPQAGQQYAFQVDLDRCSGCKACVTACHALNGLDEHETWREVGLLIGGDSAKPLMQHVTTACHHCVEPGCLIGCPVNAYTKDPVTGIVKHLDDQCFGCQYCTLACPYEVPQFHAEKGIVRKCDMCSDRLAVGEAPACVQACPHEAISIQTVDVNRVRENAEADRFLPGAPSPDITLPTTIYKTNRVLPRNTLPADYHSLRLQHAHWPLIVMLVLTQLSAGMFAVATMWSFALGRGVASTVLPYQSGLALFFGLTALIASTLHLGRPQYAFRGILGIRHSWLSREIAAFGAFAGSAVAFTVAVWQPVLTTLGVPDWLAGYAGLLGVMTSVFGLVGVYCSVMIYAFTQREFWSFPRAGAKFLLTTVWLGAVGSLAVLSCLGVDTAGSILAGLIIGVASTKLFFESMLFLHQMGWRRTSLKRSALLSTGPLRRVTISRFAFGVLGGIALPIVVIAFAMGPILTAILSVSILLLSLIGEVLERYQFFAAVSPPRMPGNVRL